MKRSGHADLPLHHGHVPKWLAERMRLLGGAIVESIVLEYGKSEFLRRLSDPFWFQSFGAVMGMDWHSSGITTSVVGALKRAINPMAHELGIHVAGGRGKHSRNTPQELLRIADRTGVDGQHLVHCSKLSAKIDNTAIQDGFQLYIHSFLVTDEGEWAVVQQGMNGNSGFARRYHWHSSQFESFIQTPHTSVVGDHQGLILNMVHEAATPTQQGVLDIMHEKPEYALTETRKLFMPQHHDVRTKDVNLKRLGAALALSQERELKGFEDVLMLPGVGPRTLQSLVLVSEIIHGTPSRFSDPARFSFAHGGKDGHPFPVPTKVYDNTIDTLNTAIRRAKLGNSDKADAIKNLGKLSERMERDFKVQSNAEVLIEHERRTSYAYGGKTVFGDAQPPKNTNGQLSLF